MSGPARDRRARWVPFAYGFRPFFLLAGIYAVVSIAAWLWIYHRGGWPLPALPPQLWHGHEMIFGFVGAAMAGFLLTAVPSWTGRPGIAGAPLVILVMLWLLGRVVFFVSPALPAALVAAAELAFMPTLILAIAPSLLRAGNRNWPMLALLALFWIADAVFLVSLVLDEPLLSQRALVAALDVVLVLITIIGGRIVPAFTGNALRASGAPQSMRSTPVVERMVLVSMMAVLLTDILMAGPSITAAIVALAAFLHLWRLAGWYGWRTARQPIVWVLHIAYLCLPIGLALRSAWLGGGFAWTAHWLHALGAGACGLMILAVMTRAALGHTGRPLRVPLSIVCAYGLLTLAVITRVLAPFVLPLGYPIIVLAAGTLWIAAFMLYLFVYTPILLKARADGKPG